GKSIELVKVLGRQGGRVVVEMSAWLMQRFETGHLAGSPLSTLPSHEGFNVWPFGEVWDSAYGASLEVRRKEIGVGRTQAWIKTPDVLVEGDLLDARTRAVTVIDCANGLAARAFKNEAVFPN